MSINNNMYLSVLIIAFLSLNNCMQLNLIHKTTCLQFEVDEIQNPVLFSYHFNPHLDQVNMIIYDKNSRIINQSGSDHNYHTFIQVKFNQTGLYPICFEKITNQNADIQFDIADQQEKMHTAGKQDINRLSKKISQFLVDIKKTGWEFKQILQQNNRMTNKLKQNQNQNYIIFASKMLLMAIILSIQFYAIKYFFQ